MAGRRPGVSGGAGGCYTAEELRAQLSSREFLSSYRHPKLAPALSEKRLVRVARSPELWVYMGRSRDYLVVPGLFCSCRDFLVNSVGRGRRRPCYHLVAQTLAAEKGAYRDLADLEPRAAWMIVLEVLDRGMSRSLRRALRSREQP